MICLLSADLSGYKAPADLRLLGECSFSSEGVSCQNWSQRAVKQIKPYLLLGVRATLLTTREESLLTNGADNLIELLAEFVQARRDRDLHQHNLSSLQVV